MLGKPLYNYVIQRDVKSILDLEIDRIRLTIESFSVKEVHKPNSFSMFSSDSPGKEGRWNRFVDTYTLNKS